MTAGSWFFAVLWIHILCGSSFFPLPNACDLSVVVFLFSLLQNNGLWSPAYAYDFQKFIISNSLPTACWTQISHWQCNYTSQTTLLSLPTSFCLPPNLWFFLGSRYHQVHSPPNTNIQAQNFSVSLIINIPFTIVFSLKSVLLIFFPVLLLVKITIIIFWTASFHLDTQIPIFF